VLFEQYARPGSVTKLAALPGLKMKFAAVIEILEQIC
jgi:hypothetical protein